MKIRNGFVSNSSSSSFLIYGVNFEDGENLFEKLTEEGKKIVIEDEDFEILKDGFFSGYDGELGEMINDQTKGFDYHHGGDYGGYYFGKSWDEVGDDQTGKEFKDSIKESIKKVFKVEDKDFGTIEECFYN